MNGHGTTSLADILQVMGKDIGIPKDALNALNALNLDALTPEQKRAILEHAAVKRLTDEALRQAKAAAHDIHDLVNKFIAEYDSDSTKKAYRANIEPLLTHCHASDTEPILLTPLQAREFANSIRADHKPAKANAIINACSAFYAYLTIAEVIERTPFMKVKRAKTDTANIKRAPTADDIAKAIAKAPPCIALAMRILADTGMRVGALVTLTLHPNGAYRAMSKGKAITGAADKACRKAMREWIDRYQADVTPNYLAVAIRRTFNGAYSAHALRHRYAIDLYTASGHDIEAVRRALHHSNIAITATYLQGLGVDMKAGA